MTDKLTVEELLDRAWDRIVNENHSVDGEPDHDGILITKLASALAQSQNEVSIEVLAGQLRSEAAYNYAIIISEREALSIAETLLARFKISLRTP